MRLWRRCVGTGFYWPLWIVRASAPEPSTPVGRAGDTGSAARWYRRRLGQRSLRVSGNSCEIGKRVGSVVDHLSRQSTIACEEVPTNSNARFHFMAAEDLRPEHPNLLIGQVHGARKARLRGVDASPSSDRDAPRGGSDGRGPPRAIRRRTTTHESGTSILARCSASTRRRSAFTTWPPPATTPARDAWPGGRAPRGGAGCSPRRFGWRRACSG